MLIITAMVLIVLGLIFIFKDRFLLGVLFLALGGGMIVMTYGKMIDAASRVQYANND
ncbi:MAG: hypothetical protein GY829_10665 [Gammaproteobacteria bacterium]|nr:hypothetical protein [Gammaproteobacteria bacterium]